MFNGSLTLKNARILISNDDGINSAGLKKLEVMDVLLSDLQKAEYLINSGLLKLL